MGIIPNNTIADDRHARLPVRLASWRHLFLHGDTVAAAGNDLLIRHIDLLRDAVHRVKRSYPFRIHGWVVLPDHLHCILELPLGDSDFAMRWRLIKAGFARRLPATEWHSPTRQRRNEPGVWQRRFWEHLIRAHAHLAAHMDYLHFNPIRHGLLGRVADWPYSTFHRLVADGVYPVDWGGGVSLGEGEFGE